tara:strand:+ start:31 stop:186 length:156 start_codon:yes stop_codon:yes gene_type:complete
VKKKLPIVDYQLSSTLQGGTEGRTLSNKDLKIVDKVYAKGSGVRKPRMGVN